MPLRLSATHEPPLQNAGVHVAEAPQLSVGSHSVRELPHVGPERPGGHVHLKPFLRPPMVPSALTRSHVPPAKQGLGWQRSADWSVFWHRGP